MFLAVSCLEGCRVPADPEAGVPAFPHGRAPLRTPSDKVGVGAGVLAGLNPPAMGCCRRAYGLSRPGRQHSADFVTGPAPLCSRFGLYFDPA